MSNERYVSRGGAKLASVADKFNLDFNDKVVLDVGSSTGGFTDYALRHGAKKVMAVDSGADQMHPSLRVNPKVELHERTDIRSLRLKNTESGIQNSEFAILHSSPDIVLVDLSFISLRQVLPYIVKLCGQETQIVTLVKPQFEAPRQARGKQGGELHRGVVKNDRIRRQILKGFELWTKNLFVIKAKADSGIAGTHGNRERFYLLIKRNT